MDKILWQPDFLESDKQVCESTIGAIVELVKRHNATILENFSEETLAVYLFLKNELYKTDVTKNLVFQFLFRSFYRIDSAGLKGPFKKKYFEVLETSKYKKASFIEIDKQLKDVSRTSRQEASGKVETENSLQFSFTSKLAASICDNCPIYDSDVARVFGFKEPWGKRSHRLEILIQRHNCIHQTYSEIIQGNLLEDLMNSFKKKFSISSSQIHDVKILDFIFWQAGKAIWDTKKKDKKEPSVNNLSQTTYTSTQ